MSNQSRSILFMVSALAILAGAVLYAVNLWIAPYLFAVGAAGFALTHFTADLKGLSFRQKRLQRFNIIASLLMIGASALMFNNRKEWVICLAISAIFILYTAFVKGE